MCDNIEVYYESVSTFNAVAGNLDNVDAKSVQAQLGFINEELDETWKALEEGDAVELLDGACDLFVTVSGLLDKLYEAGFDIGTALERVCDNNLSKFPYDVESEGKCPEGAVMHKGRYSRVVFKRESDGKVMKPTNFKPVDLSDLVPEQPFFGGAA